MPGTEWMLSWVKLGQHYLLLLFSPVSICPKHPTAVGKQNLAWKHQVPGHLPSQVGAQLCTFLAMWWPPSLLFLPPQFAPICPTYQLWKGQRHGAAMCPSGTALVGNPALDHPCAVGGWGQLQEHEAMFPPGQRLSACPPGFHAQKCLRSHLRWLNLCLFYLPQFCVKF